MTSEKFKRRYESDFHFKYSDMKKTTQINTFKI